MKNIEENNKLIAEFMGFKYPTKKQSIENPRLGIIYDKSFHNKLFGEDPYEGLNDDDILFNTSWDWLMPVVEKIEELGISTSIDYFGGLNFCKMLGYKKPFIYFELDIHNKSKINAVYNSVLKFIKWYNNENKINNGRKNNKF